jgi:Tol biopolymer transport system component
MTRALVLAVCAACGRLDFGTVADAPGAWGPATQVFPPNGEFNPTLTSDMLELFFVRNGQIYVTTRTSVADAWSMPVLVAELATASFDGVPEVSGDGLTMYFLSTRISGTGRSDIFMASRVSRSDLWSGIVQVPELESTAVDGTPVVADDGLTLVMPSSRGGDSDLYTSTRPTTASTWATPVSLAGVNSSAYDSDPFMMNDRLAIYFRSDRDGTADLFVARRASIAYPFGTPVAIPELDTPSMESDPWVSPDQRTIFFSSDRSGVEALYMATR